MTQCRNKVHGWLAISFFAFWFVISVLTMMPKASDTFTHLGVLVGLAVTSIALLWAISQLACADKSPMRRLLLTTGYCGVLMFPGFASFLALDIVYPLMFGVELFSYPEQPGGPGTIYSMVFMLVLSGLAFVSGAIALLVSFLGFQTVDERDGHLKERKEDSEKQ